MPSPVELILADTKFEFGKTPDGIILADEVLTPDSSRFWDGSGLEPGGPSLRSTSNSCETIWNPFTGNKQAPAPGLPDHVVERTQAKYLEAFRQADGRKLIL